MPYEHVLSSQVTIIYKAFLQCRLCQSSFTVLLDPLIHLILNNYFTNY